MVSKRNQPMLIVTLLVILAVNASSRSSPHATAENRFSDEAAFAPPLQPYECPYPCLPSPNCPPPPPPPRPPPPYGWLYPPSPPVNYPFYPPPDYVNNYVAPPPPDPILPYFPFYYKNPPPPLAFSSAGGVPSPLRACWILFIAQIFTRLI
ncbi:hypothetical protein C2S51_016886 [Perilla frutescens var. frutescens]|nr:hypothetical protein C2S51_016886 [Perilla frutescens var. frutescens]